MYQTPTNPQPTPTNPENTLTMSRTIAAIVNPVSGRRDMTPEIRAIEHAVRAGGGAFSVYTTKCAGHATEIAASLEGGVDALLVVGGDGTVCEVANGLVGVKTPLAILRTGTENLLAHYLGMPIEPQRMADLLLRGRSAAHDVGVMNGRRFLALAGIGFDGLCVHRLSAVRRGHITHLDYSGPVWRSLLEYDFPKLTVIADGEEVFCDRGFIIMGIIPRYSLGLRVAARAVPDDGLLDVVMFRCRSLPALIAQAARIFAGKHLDHPAVVYKQCRCARFECEGPVPIQIDGDPGGFAPAECSILPAAAWFLTDEERQRASSSP